MTTPFEMISAPAALRTLVDRLQEEAVLAFDTEFTWERTDRAAALRAAARL